MDNYITFEGDNDNLELEQVYDTFVENIKTMEQEFIDKMESEYLDLVTPQVKVVISSQFKNIVENMKIHQGKRITQTFANAMLRKLRAKAQSEEVAPPFEPQLTKLYNQTKKELQDIQKIIDSTDLEKLSNEELDALQKQIFERYNTSIKNLEQEQAIIAKFRDEYREKCIEYGIHRPNDEFENDIRNLSFISFPNATALRADLHNNIRKEFDTSMNRFISSFKEIRLPKIREVIDRTIQEQSGNIEAVKKKIKTEIMKQVKKIDDTIKTMTESRNSMSIEEHQKAIKEFSAAIDRIPNFIQGYLAVELKTSKITLSNLELQEVQEAINRQLDISKFKEECLKIPMTKLKQAEIISSENAKNEAEKAEAERQASAALKEITDKIRSFIVQYHDHLDAQHPKPFSPGSQQKNILTEALVELDNIDARQAKTADELIRKAESYTTVLTNITSKKDLFPKKAVGRFSALKNLLASFILQCSWSKKNRGLSEEDFDTKAKETEQTVQRLIIPGFRNLRQIRANEESKRQAEAAEQEIPNDQQRNPERPIGPGSRSQ